MGSSRDEDGAERAADGPELGRRLAALTDNMPDAMVYQVVASADGSRHFTYVSGGVAALHGLTPAEVYADASRLYGQIHPDDAPRVAAAEEVSRETSSRFEVEVRIVTPGGALRWSLLRSSPHPNADGSTIWDGVEIDITERKHAEEALRASQDRYRALTSIGSEGIMIHEAGILVEMNRRFAELIEVEDPRALIGKDGRSLIAFTDASRELIRRRVADQADYEPFEVELVRRDGSIRVAETSGANIIFDGRPMRLVTMRDVTARKRAELDRAALEERVWQAQKMESIGRLAGGVAHDFNNLLTVIGGNVSVIEATLEDDAAREALADVAKAVTMAANLTRQLLAFSRKQVVHPRVLGLNEVVSRLRAVLGRVLGEDVILETRLASDLPTVKIDPGHLEQIVLNLAVNARDAMPRGGVLLLSTWVELEPTPMVILSVKDTGVGMTEETRARAFEPFFTTKAPDQGTGLGLAIVYGAVTAAGGEVDVRSEVGRGTEVRVRLPATDEVVVNPTSRRAAAPSGSERIVLVEDEPLVRDLALRVLRGLGYGVTAFGSGEEALRTLDSGALGTVDLLFTDVVMPEVGGRELAERFTARSPSTKVLYTSGHTEDTVVHHGVRENTMAFLPKPYSATALAEHVRRVLDGNR